MWREGQALFCYFLLLPLWPCLLYTYHLRVKRKCCRTVMRHSQAFDRAVIRLSERERERERARWLLLVYFSFCLFRKGVESAKVSSSSSSHITYTSRERNRLPAALPLFIWFLFLFSPPSFPLLRLDGWLVGWCLWTWCPLTLCLALLLLLLLLLLLCLFIRVSLGQTAELWLSPKSFSFSLLLSS